MIRRRYIDSRYGQLHLRENDTVGGVPLLCLHATAYSSRSFGALLTALDGRRHAVAADMPGYGESDAPAEPIAIGDYADAMMTALPHSGDIFGYHTGVSIAVEMAIRHPERVRRLVLVGIPHFRALDFDHWRARLTHRHTLEANLVQFEERWDFLVANRPGGLSLQRGFDNFVDELKAWPNGSWAHEALFAHDLAARLPLVRQPVLVLNPPGHLAEPSRIAARLLSDVIVEELDTPGAVLDRHAALVADRLDTFLGEAFIPNAVG